MSENPYGVTLATDAEAPALLHFVLPLIAENAAQTVSEAKVAALVARCTGQERGIAGIIIGPLGIEASVGMTIDEDDYTDEPHVAVRWLGVSRDARASGLQGRLIGFTRWFHTTLSAMGTPMPVFLSSLLTPEQRKKVLARHTQIPLVSVTHAFGVLPGRALLTPWQVAGPKQPGDRSMRREPPHVGIREPVAVN